MDSTKQAVKNLMVSITKIVMSEIKKNNKTRTYIVTAQVTSVNNDGSYTVRFQDSEHKAKSRFNHNVGDFVRVLVENGNLSNMTIIY